MYECTRCKQSLPAESFSPSQLQLRGRWCRSCHNEHRRNKRAGVVPKRTVESCLQCGASLEEKRSHAKFCSQPCLMRHRRAENPDGHRPYYVKFKYGLTSEQLVALYVQQQGRCWICTCTLPDPTVRQLNRKKSQAHIDHCHRSGRVRGILCFGCNTGLGAFKDDVQALRTAIQYLALDA